MANYSLQQINLRIQTDAEAFIDECEKAYTLQLDRIVKDIENTQGRILVMLAGPSSSGKTTTAGLLKKKLEKRGRSACVISLDDFYLTPDKPHTFEDGTVDYERVEALDVPLIEECLRQLVRRGEALLPRYSFTKRMRDGFEAISVADSEIIIVEGLHALNPVIVNPLSSEKMLKLYVSVSSRITDSDEVLFSKRDLRFLRRLIRDYYSRNSEVEFIFYLWKGVRMGEDRYLFPFKDNADIKIDSVHPYEIALFRNSALELLDHIAENSVYYKYADELKTKLRQVSALERGMMPDSSLLGEFIV